MSIDREIVDQLRQIAANPAPFSTKRVSEKAAKEIETRERMLDLLGEHLAQSDIDRLLASLEARDADLLCEYFGWSQYFEAEIVFADACPNDTNGDGNCGNRFCPHCGDSEIDP